MRKHVQERNMGLHHNNEQFEIIVKLSENTVVALQSWFLYFTTPYVLLVSHAFILQELNKI